MLKMLKKNIYKLNSTTSANKNQTKNLGSLKTEKNKQK